MVPGPYYIDCGIVYGSDKLHTVESINQIDFEKGVSFKRPSILPSHVKLFANTEWKEIK
jgi:hypothetical protein